MTDDDTNDQTTDDKLRLFLNELCEVKAKLSALEAEAEERTRNTRLELDKLTREIFDNERLRSLRLEEEIDQRLDALIGALAKYEARQERMEEAFMQVAESHQLVVRLAGVYGERLDGISQANLQTESRLETLIEAQILLLQRMDTLTGDIAALNGRVDKIGAHLDLAVEQIRTLTAAQTRTDEQIKKLLDREVSKKTGRTSAKVTKKEAAL